jgi:outer membrane protein assembly factor BamB
VAALCAALAAALASGPVYASETPEAGATIAAELEWNWSLFGDQIGASGLFVADLDENGTLEIVAAHRGPDHLFGAGDHWFEISYDGVARQSWSSLAFAQRIVRLRPVDGDGGIDVAIATATNIRVVDGSSKQLARSIPGIANELRDFLVIDLDSNGTRELVLCDAGDLAVLDYATLVAQGSAAGVSCSALDAGQADGDPQLELLVLGAPDGLVLDGATLAPDWSRPGSVGSFARLVDLDADGSVELVASDALGNSLQAVDLPSGAVLWTSPVASWTVEAIAPTVAVEPAGPRLIVGSSGSPPGLRALDALTGAPDWSVAVDSRDYRGLVTSDVDDDGTLEALFGANHHLGPGERLVVVDLAVRVIEHETFSYTAPLSGLSAGDADADGHGELVTASRGAHTESDGGRLLVLDPESRVIEYGQTAPTIELPVVLTSVAAQLDGDPQLELCTAGWYAIVCEDGSTHLEHWTIDFPWGVEVSALAATDIDGDGRDEVLAGSESGLVYAFDGTTGWLKWRSPPTSVSGSVAQLRVADAIGSGAKEVVVTSRFHSGSQLAILDLGTGRYIWYPVAFSSWWALGLAQLDADPELDLLLGSEWGDIAVVDLDTRTVGPPILSIGEPIAGVAAADLTGDPAPELAVRDATRLRLFGGSPLSELWTSPYLGPVGNVEPLRVGNFDSDPEWEILALSWSSIAAFEVPFPGLFADGFESGDTAAWSASAPLDDR